MAKQYRSKLLGAAHPLAEDLTSAGMLNKKTMRQLDARCLTPVEPLEPKQIQEIRERQNASQGVFARYLGVSVGLVSQWERGDKKPSGSFLKLRTLVAHKGLDWVA